VCDRKLIAGSLPNQVKVRWTDWLIEKSIGKLKKELKLIAIGDAQFS
jgi:hypothetical protein